MNKNWPTKEKDLITAQRIMEDYASRHKLEALGLFEVVVDEIEKKMDFRLSPWVAVLAEHFQSQYGEAQGDYITRQVISRCMIKNQTIH
ncbi:MAG: hypothetical protein JJT82_02930 [Legionellaceae bacterium]|nr:hypothetical protein [Legionellaceae bacterium]